MVVPAFHITDEDSVSDPDNVFFLEPGPATLLMDADAWFISPGSTIVLHTGSWTATINGKVTSSDFSGGGNVAIYLYATAIPHAITIGETAEITGYTAGIWAEAGADIINKGNIVGAGPSGYGIRHSVVGGDYKITNSGSISGGALAIDLTNAGAGTAGGIHTIINFGLLDGPNAILSIHDLAVEKVTNSGQINGLINLGGGNDSFTNTGGVLGDFLFGDGNDSFTNKGTVTGVTNLGSGIGLVDFGIGNDKFTNGGIIDAFVDLGDGNDVFTNFAKVKVKGKLVQRDGEVAQSIELGCGNDTFNGGNKAEVVFDRYGADTYKLGGGNDTYFSMFYSSGIGLPDGAQDFVDGGAGRDYYYGDLAGGVINLDNKVHDGFAANLASLLTDHSLDEHIFNFEDASGSSGADRIYGTAGANSLNGDFGNDQIYGLAGNDTLGGDGGNDHLYGGAGRDVMTGDVGGLSGGENPEGDTFHFLSLSDSGVTRATRDLITDFVNATDPGFRDLIDLSAIDAITGTPANDDFTFIGLSKWHHVAGELRYVWTATQTFVEADVNGDAKVDFSVALDGQHALTASDFVGVSGTSAAGPVTPATNHITNDNSGHSGAASAFIGTGPGSFLMDAGAFLISDTNTIRLTGGPWTATINGRVTSSNFSGPGDWGIQIGTSLSAIPGSSLTIGASGEVTGSHGVLGFSPIDIFNKGNIVATSGFAIRQSLSGDCTINNSGTITAFAGLAIEFRSINGGGGTHTIINSGSIDGLTAIENLSADGIERVTNTGQINGKIDLGGGNDSFTNTGGVLGDFYFGDGNDSFTNRGHVIGVHDFGSLVGIVDFGTGNDKFTNGGIIDAHFVVLGEGDDVFTNFAKVKVKGKTVQKDGFVAGQIILGSGNDTFMGGNKAEVVIDDLGADTYKLGGGNDAYFSLFYTDGIGLPDGAQDFVDGGAGRDTYYGDIDGVINLDNKVHDGFAANLVSQLTNHSLDEHIFNFEDAVGSDGVDHIYGTAGANYLNGNSGNDQIYGLAGNDILDGDFGNDHLYGGAGRDVMTGSDNNGPSGGTGEAADTFHFLSLSDSGVTRATRDLITDFVNATDPGFRDLIDLSAIDAITGTPANDDFTFIGLSKWHHVAGELRYVWTATQTFVEADVNGDAKVDFSVALDGHLTLTAADFVGVV